jgi:hypothetical protein
MRAGSCTPSDVEAFSTDGPVTPYGKGGMMIENDGRRVAPMLLGLIWGAAGRRALVVALVIGTLLNAINQGDALLGGAPLHWGKIALTYAVPFCVSLHGAAAALRGRS